MQMRSILAEWWTFWPSSHATPSPHDRSFWNSAWTHLVSWAFIVSSTSFAITLIMHLLLRSEPVITAFSPEISFNLLSRSRASAAKIDDGVSVAELLLTLGFAYKAITSVIPFVIVDFLAELEILLGSDWKEWCIHNNAIKRSTKNVIHKQCHVPLLCWQRLWALLLAGLTVHLFPQPLGWGS